MQSTFKMKGMGVIYIFYQSYAFNKNHMNVIYLEMQIKELVV